MWRRCAHWALLVAFSLLASAATAESLTAGDPCAANNEAAAPSPSARSRIRIERDTAIYVAKHAQRACRPVDGLANEYSARNDPRRAAEFRSVIGKLRDEVLEPIYREYPDLRGQDLTSSQSQEDQRIAARQNTKASAQEFAARERTMGPATALYLRWTLAVAVHGSFSKAIGPKACDWPQNEKCVRALDDGDAEIVFAEVPIYWSYPDLWRLAMKEGEALAATQKRTAESDAAFRKAAPPRGSVRLTPAAASFIRDFLDEARREGASSCQIATISWVRQEQWKGPNDADWTIRGPHLSTGAHGCGEIPPDVIQAIDGIRIVFEGDVASRFAGKAVDLENGDLVLKEK